MPTRSRAPAKRGKTPRATKKAGAAGVNHKTPEAQAARDDLDQRVGKLLLQKSSAEGLGKVDLATKLGADASAVKASCNRLARAGVITSSGTTMNTVYKATANATAKLAAMKPSSAKKRPASPAPAAAEAD